MHLRVILAPFGPRAAGRRRPALRLRSLPERVSADDFFLKIIKTRDFLYRNHRYGWNSEQIKIIKIDTNY